MNNVTPLISIAMTTYNGESYLAQQLESILNQSFKNFELIICDDNSSDNTIKIIEKFKNKFNFIKLYKNTERLGVVKNFEKAINLSTAKYIALSDQDDIWHNEKLEELLSRIDEYPTDEPILVHSDLTIVDSNLTEIHKSFFKYRGIKLANKKSVNKIISHNGVMGCAILFNQALKSKMLPFPKDLDVHDYWIALVNEAFGKRITLNKSLIKYRVHQTNASNNRDKILKKRNIFTSMFNDDELPFIGINREAVLKEFLDRYEVKKDDVKKISIFIEYLEGKSNPLKIIYNLLKYDIIRNNIRYKIKLFIKIIQRRFR